MVGQVGPLGMDTRSTLLGRFGHEVMLAVRLALGYLLEECWLDLALPHVRLFTRLGFSPDLTLGGVGVGGRLNRPGEKQPGACYCCSKGSFAFHLSLHICANPTQPTAAPAV